MKKLVVILMLCVGVSAHSQVVFGIDYGALEEQAERLQAEADSPEHRALVLEMKAAEERWAAVWDSIKQHRQHTPEGWKEKPSKDVQLLGDCYPALLRLQARMLKTDIQQSQAYKDLCAQIVAVKKPGEEEPALNNEANEVINRYLDKENERTNRMSQPEGSLQMNAAVRLATVLRLWPEEIPGWCSPEKVGKSVIRTTNIREQVAFPDK